MKRYHSIQVAPGMRPLRGAKSGPYGEELAPIHSSTSRTSSSFTSLPSAASISSRVTIAEATVSGIGKVAGVGVTGAVSIGRPAAFHAASPPCRMRTFG